MKFLIILMVVLLSGCATPPRFLAAMYDSNDPCQNYYNRADYKLPNFCGSGSGTRYVTRDFQSGRALTITKAEK
jgi:uncharacterized protein YceK